MRIQTLVELTIMPYKYFTGSGKDSDIPENLKTLFIANNFYVFRVQVPIKDEAFIEISSSIAAYDDIMKKLKCKYGDVYCIETLIDKTDTLMKFKKETLNKFGFGELYDFTVLGDGLASLSFNVSS